METFAVVRKGETPEEVGIVEQRKPAWTCPVCGFEAKDDQEKQRHMTETANDPKHKGKEQAARPS